MGARGPPAARSEAGERIAGRPREAALVRDFSFSARLCTSRICNGNSHVNLGPTGPRRGWLYLGVWMFLGSDT